MHGELRDHISAGKERFSAYNTFLQRYVIMKKNNTVTELYLIGNGFDMHHNINSSYSQFKKWLEIRDPVIYNRLFQVYELSGGDLWSSLEENLGNIPIDAILDNYVYSPFMIFFDRTDGNNGFFNLDDFSDGSIPEIGLTLHRLYFYLELYFTEWILQLEDPDYNQRVLINRSNTYFINFNYTKTLETAYGIPQKDINYIHGCASLNEQLIFGHNQTPETIKRNWQFDLMDDDEKELLEEAINDMGTLYKDVNSIIQNSQKLWEKLSEVNTIHVWGLSLSDVDIPYLIHIKSIVKPNTKWEFSWFNANDKKHKEDMIKRLSIENASLIQLSDIVRPYPKQLSLFE